MSKFIFTHDPVELFLGGATVAEVAKITGAAEKTVRKRLGSLPREQKMRLRMEKANAAGISSGREEECAKYAVDQYLKGATAAAIAETIGRTHHVVNHWLDAAGVRRTRSETWELQHFGKGRVPSDWSFEPLTASRAWLLGLIFGDGNLDSRNGTFSVASGDRDIIENINSLFDGRLSVYDVKNSKCQIIKVHSVRLYRELQEMFGLTPNKSRTMRFPSLPKWVLPHFSRGLLDSDGGWTPRGKSLRFSYSSASEIFVNYFQGVLVQQLGLPWNNLSISSTHNPLWTIVYYHKNAIAIGNWLYEQSIPEIRCLRKFRVWKTAMDYASQREAAKRLDPGDA